MLARLREEGCVGGGVQLVSRAGANIVELVPIECSLFVNHGAPVTFVAVLGQLDALVAIDSSTYPK